MTEWKWTEKYWFVQDDGPSKSNNASMPSVDNVPQHILFIVFSPFVTKRLTKSLY